MNDADIGRYSRIRRAIVGPGVKIPEASVIGYDLQEDRSKGYTVTDSGIVVICADQGSFPRQESYNHRVAG